MKSKKGALQLSVNAVVVIIIAIVMLGLALGFMRTIFGEMIEEFKGVSAEVKSQMKKTLEERTEKAALLPEELELAPGKSERVYLGINNYLSEDVEFFISCVNCNDNGGTWDECGNKALRSCSAFGGDDSQCEDAITVKGYSSRIIDRGEIDVVSFTVVAGSSAASDTYNIPIHVCGSVDESVIEEVVNLEVTVR